MKQAGNKARTDSVDGIVAGLTMQPSLRARGHSCFLAPAPERTKGSLQNQSDGVFGASAERATRATLQEVTLTGSWTVVGCVSALSRNQDPERTLPQWAYRATVGFDLKH